MTSAELNKQLKKLQCERGQLLELEQMSACFVAATTENVEEIRPEYDLLATNDTLIKLEKEIREINMEFRARYESGVDGPEKADCGYKM